MIQSNETTRGIGQGLRANGQGPLSSYIDNLQSIIVDNHSMGKPNDLVQGTLDLLILKTISLEPKHGWAIAKRIEQISNDVLQVQQGSLYPALHRLERRGWVKARWGTSENSRRAKYYELTQSGRRRLDAETEAWEKLAGAVAQILGTA